MGKKILLVNEEILFSLTVLVRRFRNKGRDNYVFRTVGLSWHAAVSCSTAFRNTTSFVKDRWAHTTKCCLTKMEDVTVHCDKYIPTYKYLPCKNCGIWKQNTAHVEDNYIRWTCVCVCPEFKLRTLRYRPFLTKLPIIFRDTPDTLWRHTGCGTLV
jgi:hypothetical protein